MAIIQRTIDLKISRQFCVFVPEGEGPFPILMGFHGYGETGENQMKILQKIAQGMSWIFCAPDGLHEFYNRKSDPGCSWMTARCREDRIRENIFYINNVNRLLREEYNVSETIVYHGFSQGTSMAVRAAVLSDYPSQNVMLLAGDIPEDTENLEKLSHVLIGKGDDDNWYTEKKYQKDKRLLEKYNVNLNQCVFQGGHECHEDYIQAARTFLKTSIKLSKLS